MKPWGVPTEATATADVDLLTTPGATISTVAYMSPEQARGQDLDARGYLAVAPFPRTFRKGDF